MVVRAFIAIELPDTIKEALGDLSQRLRPCGVRASWVKPERMHLTLRFLGEVSENDAERVGDFLEAAYRDLKPFEVTVAGVGAFPNLRRPSVVWVGVEPVRGSLARAQSVAEEAACHIGLPREKRAFRAHLTLARIKEERKADALTTLLEHERSFAGGSFSVRSVSLFGSRLTPKGPIYRHLRKIALP